jgi:hypothetical protein
MAGKLEEHPEESGFEERFASGKREVAPGKAKGNRLKAED